MFPLYFKLALKSMGLGGPLTEISPTAGMKLPKVDRVPPAVVVRALQVLRATALSGGVGAPDSVQPQWSIQTSTTGLCTTHRAILEAEHLTS